MDERIRIIIADDHQLFRQGLISLFDNIYDITVVDEASDGDDLVAKYLHHKPDVVIADISMPNLSGFDAFKQIKKYDPKARFLFLSMFDSSEYVHYTRKIGGSGLIGKNIKKDELGFGIRKIMDGGEFFGENWTEEKLEELEQNYRNLADGVIDPNIALTIKEKEILYFVSEGYTSTEIAGELKLSKRTVDAHRHNLMKKLKVTSLSQFIAYAIKFVAFNESQTENSSNPSK